MFRIWLICWTALFSLRTANVIERKLRFVKKHPTKSLLDLRCYPEAFNERREPSPRLSAWATQLREKDIAAMSLATRRGVRFDRSEIAFQIDSDENHRVDQPVRFAFFVYFLFTIYDASSVLSVEQ